MPIHKEYLVQTPDGILDVVEDFLAPGEEPRCDFCSGQPVVFRYGCPDFTTAGTLPNGKRVDWVSHGFWAACHACSEFIENNKPKALLRRALRSAVRVPDIWREQHAAMVERHLGQFLEKRLPERVPYNHARR